MFPNFAFSFDFVHVIRHELMTPHDIVFAEYLFLLFPILLLLLLLLFPTLSFIGILFELLLPLANENSVPGFNCCCS